MAEVLKLSDYKAVPDIKICNCCGRQLTDLDQFKITKMFGYGTKRDLDILDLELCNECADKLTNKLIGVCKAKSPVIEWTGDIYRPYKKNDFKLSLRGASNSF